MPIDAPLTTEFACACVCMMRVVMLVGIAGAAARAGRGGHVQAGVEAQRSGFCESWAATKAWW